MGSGLGDVFVESLESGEMLQRKQVERVGEFSKVRVSEKNQTTIPYTEQFLVQKARNCFPKKKNGEGKGTINFGAPTICQYFYRSYLI